jgi:spore coat protein A
MISRRDFLRMAGTAAAALAIPWKVQSGGMLKASRTYAAAKPREFSGSKPGISFTKYVDPLPMIQVMPAAGMMNHYRIAMQQFTQKIHRDLPPTTLWGFGAVGSRPSAAMFPTQPIIAGPGKLVAIEAVGPDIDKV